MIEGRDAVLTRLGFRFGISGPHSSRTMMLEDLDILLTQTPASATRSDFAAAIVDENLLGKPTKAARERALHHLAALYALDMANPLFRALRRLWPLDVTARPMLALAVSLARDPLLRETRAFFLEQEKGTEVPREAVEAFLNPAFSARFSPSSLRALAQNVAGTWTNVGVLEGRSKKIRAKPHATPSAATMLLFLGYLEGRTGQRLFSSEWLEVLDCTSLELEELTNAASHRGLLVFMNAGGVKEVRFPDYLTPEEEQIRQEVSHVV